MIDRNITPYALVWFRDGDMEGHALFTAYDHATTLRGTLWDLADDATDVTAYVLPNDVDDMDDEERIQVGRVHRWLREFMETNNER